MSSPHESGVRIMGQKTGVDRFLDETGKITAWPKGTDDRRLILSFLAGKFEYGRTYREAEITRTISESHSFMNPTMLRRELIIHGFMARKPDGSAYWRIKTGDQNN